jgi:hypothetical protein
MLALFFSPAYHESTMKYIFLILPVIAIFLGAGCAKSIDPDANRVPPVVRDTVPIYTIELDGENEDTPIELEVEPVTE